MIVLFPPPQAQGPAYQRIVMSIPRLKGRFVGTGADSSARV